VRPRDLVLACLRAVGEITDPDGRASAALAEATGYSGSSMAFAQLLSGMERSGMIEREVRGKRTYRIALAPAQGPDSGTQGSAPDPGSGPGGAAIDYDELARRLLVEVVRRAAAPSAAAPGDLARTVTSLERKLAGAEARQRTLRAENARLRELLAMAKRSLAEQRFAAGEPGDYPGEASSYAQESGPRQDRPANTAAVQLLERLLASLRGEGSPGQSA
jgi:hypothetical protein